MPSFSIPLSGLNADSTALNTIANNLSNMSTTGFKEQTTNFSDLFYEQVGTTGAGGEIQQGTGVQVASNSTDFTGGAISSTGIATDVAIDGTGFFVLNTGGGQQLYSRDGNFQLSSTGTLESTQGQGVMGYAATNGVINTSGGLSNITIPTGQVMQPSATTSFSLSQNLDSESPVGTQATGQVQVYDSLGKSYEATVTYTNLGNNKWSYAITLPDTLSASAATAPAATTLPVTTGAATASTSVSTLVPTVAAGGVSTVYTYNFGTGGTVASTTSMTINGTPLVIPSAGESVASLEAQINTVVPGAAVPTTVNGSTILTVTLPNADVASSTMNAMAGDLAVSTTNYNFGSTATVDAATSLTITGQNAAGQPSFITVTAGADEPVSTYYGQINAALAAAAAAGHLTNVSASVTDNQLSVTGAGIVITGSASQDLTASTISYNFGTSGGAIATVDSSTNLTITGLTAEGATATTVAPTITAGETVAQYVTALTSALATAGIAGVGVSSTADGQLSITGANLSTAGSVIQDPVASANASGTLSFNSSGNLVGPTSNLSNISVAGLSDSAAALNMTWNLFGATGSGNISQTAAASGQSAQTQNGYTSGEYQNFTIGSDGTVSATYSNGQSQTVGQLAIATVSNQQGLLDVGSTEYQATANSGLATVGVASSGGRGSLEGSSLEASNVNISTEFSDLIVAQRAFEANAKSVTTFDTITQETINMIH
jgi:flagellar hook protein FlgE